MGYSLSWLAVKGASPQAIREELGFRPTGQREEIPEADLSAVELPNGWYVIVSNRSEQVASDAALQHLSSSGCELVTCFVEEHVMVSQATAWAGGQLRWSVTHDAQQRRDHLETQGEPPAAFSDILNQWKARQQEADAKKEGVDFIFEVPVELAYSLVGYRHDRDNPELGGDAFEVLVETAPERATSPKRPSFWKRLFGVNTMKSLLLLAFAVTGLLLAGCTKPSPVATGSAATQVTDWGVIEVVPSTPTHLKLAGKHCTLTATPLADGKFAVLIEGDFGVTGANSPAGVPPGTPIHTTHNMIVPGNVECLCGVDHKPVRFTLKLKQS